MSSPTDNSKPPSEYRGIESWYDIKIYIHKHQRPWKRAKHRRRRKYIQE